MGARSLLVAVVGYSLAIAMGTSYEIQYFDLLSGPGRLLSCCAYTVGELAALTGLLVLSHRRPGLDRLEVPTWLLVLGVAGLVSTVVGVSSGGPAGAALPALGSLFQGCQRSAFVLAWFCLLARLGDRDVLLALCWSHLASACLSFVLAWLGASVPEAVGLCLAAMPFLSAALLKGLLSEGQPRPRADASPSGWTFPVRPVAFVAVFTLINNFVRSFLPGQDAAMTVLGVVVGSAPILVAAYIVRDRPILPTLREVSLPVLLAGCLCLGVAGGGLAGGLLTNAGFVCLDVFTFAALCRMPRRYGINPVWLIAPAKAAAFAASRVGELTGYAVSSAPPGPEALGLALAVAVPVLVLAFNLFATRTDIGGSWGVVPSSDPPDAVGEVEETPVASVDVSSAVARSRGLTRREEDVLLLLLQERSVLEVAQELFVSEATARSHIQHIYKKLEVHNRSELMDACSRAAGGR